MDLYYKRFNLQKILLFGICHDEVPDLGLHHGKSQRAKFSDRNID
jgi:hypothetical protein